jgi:hypothetical protein
MRTVLVSCRFWSALREALYLPRDRELVDQLLIACYIFVAYAAASFVVGNKLALDSRELDESAAHLYLYDLLLLHASNRREKAMASPD